MEISTEQLLGIIGQKQVQIEVLQAQLKVLSEGYESQRKELEQKAIPQDHLPKKGK